MRRNIPELPKVDTSVFQQSVQQAVQEALRNAQARPSDPEATATLGMVLHAHDQFSAAIACYRRAASIDPRNASYPYYEGVALSTDGKHAEAVDALKRAVSMNSSSIPAHLRLADTYFETGHSDLARDQYRAVLALNAAIPQAHFGFARTLQGQQTIDEYRRALELFHTYGAAQFALATELRKIGRNDEAERTLTGYEQNRLLT